MKIIDALEFQSALKKMPPTRKYLGMYSTLWEGIVTDPDLMLLPIDDHMVHRGDGVFEAIRVTPQKLYLLEEHIARLFRSAARIFLEIPKNEEGIMQMCREVCAALSIGPNTGNPREGIIRLFVGRGPGDFSPNPYATIGAQIYLVVTPFVEVPKEKYKNGVSVHISEIPAKTSQFAQIKSCNYLQNVLMKKESIDHKCDFSVGVTDDGYISEGPTENIMLLNKKNELIAPRFDYTLRGTTLVRAMELAKSMDLKNIRVDDIELDELKSAKEVMMVGTTLGVLPVTRIDGHPIGEGPSSGHVGDLAVKLNSLIRKDMGVL